MTTIPQKNKDAYWQTHIDNYLSSSLSVNKYCEQNNLVPHHFKYRYQRYRHNIKHPTQQPSKIQSDFVPIEVTATQPISTTFEVLLPNGIQCRVSPPFDTAALKQLLGVLKP